jgi:hypothetical protein
MFHARNFIWIALFSASIGWLYLPREELRDGQTLAVITSTQGNVSLRAAGSFNWISIQTGSKIFPMDSISTGHSSSATFEMSDKTRFELPEDTQLKLQTIALDRGISISLVQGGISVQVHDEIEHSQQKSKHSAGLSPNIRAPILVKAAQYNIDLSKLTGTFQIKPNQLVTATHPKQIRVQAPSGVTMDLAQLQQMGMQTINNKETPSLPSAMLPTQLSMDPPSIPMPAVSAQDNNTLDSSLPDKKSIPNIETIAEQNNKFPLFKLSSFDFYWHNAISVESTPPLVIPATDKRQDSDVWQAVFKVSRTHHDQSVTIKRKVEQRGFVFSLAEIKSILPSKSFEQLELVIEPGLIPVNSEGKEIRMSGIETKIRLLSLIKKKALTLKFDRLTYVQPDANWFSLLNRGPFLISLHLWDATVLPELEGFIRGAQSTSIQTLESNAKGAPVHIVRGSKIILSLSTKDPAIIGKLSDQLRANLVFHGDKSAFLGGKGSFNFEQQLEKLPQTFYVRRNKVLLLDKNLIMAQEVARNFIKKLDPYFFSDTVEILYNKIDETYK